jgi:hypothetical protein
MSWSASVNSHSREQFDKAVDDVVPSPSTLDEHMQRLFSKAKEIVKAIAPIVPGPLLSASMLGHANGVGDQKKEGYVNDYITVTVSQQGV